MSTDEKKLPEVPATELELGIRGLRSYVAKDGEDLVLVLEEDDPHGEGLVVTLEPGIGANSPEAIEAAETLGRTALHWAELMRVRAGDRRPIQAS
jgi:hypothetical protein